MSFTESNTVEQMIHAAAISLCSGANSSVLPEGFLQSTQQHSHDAAGILPAW
jgi:hypothetical protein